MELLRALLERASVNLLYLTATFLKKLSVSLAVTVGVVVVVAIFFLGKLTAISPRLPPPIRPETDAPPRV